MDVSIAQEEDPVRNRRLLEVLTARLPEWFAQDEANRHYAAQAEILEAWVARIDGRAVCCCSKSTAPSARKFIGWASTRTIIGRELERP